MLTVLISLILTSLLCGGVYTAAQPGGPLHGLHAWYAKHFHQVTAMLLFGCIRCMSWLYGSAMWITLMRHYEMSLEHVIGVVPYVFMLMGLNAVLDEILS